MQADPRAVEALHLNDQRGPRQALDAGAPVTRPTSATASPHWEPQIPFDRVQVPTFPVEVLPEWLRNYVKAEAIATQTPVDLPAMLGLVVTAAACAGKARVRLKAGHEEPLNIFAVIVLAPGNRKSAVFRDMTAPVEEFEVEEAERLHDSIASATQRRRILDGRLKSYEDRAARSEGAERLKMTEAADRVRRERETLIVPVAPRLIVDDCSPEKLASLLHQHGGRIALLSSEGDAFDMMAGRYSNSGMANLSVYLKGHAGDSLRVDRQGRGAEFVHSPALTLGLTIQPEVLRGLMSRPGFRGRGVLARILYSLPVSTLGRREVDAPPASSGARDAYALGVRALLRLTPAPGALVPGVVGLAPDARRAFAEFEREIEPQLGEFGELASIADWAAKLAGVVGRIAGLFHLADHIDHPAPWELTVTRDCLARAIRVGQYLVPHARRSFSQMGADPAIESALYLMRLIERAACPSLSRRDLFERAKGRFERVADMDPILALLQEHRFIRAMPESPRAGPGRRPSPIYEVNPAVYSRNSQKHAYKDASADTANSENVTDADSEDGANG